MAITCTCEPALRLESLAISSYPLAATYRESSPTTSAVGGVKGRAELAIRLETITLPRGSVYKFSPTLASVDAGAGEQKVVGKENSVQEGSTHAEDAARIAILAGSGGALGAIVDEGARGAGIGAGAGAAVGLATVLLTRGREVELRQGTTLDVIFDRPVALQ